eukprot:gene9880-18469_t
MITADTMQKLGCYVEGCNNDSRYPDKIVKGSNIEELKFYYFPKDAKKRRLWVKEVEKGPIGLQISKNKCFKAFSEKAAKQTELNG